MTPFERKITGFAQAPHVGDVVLCRFPYEVGGQLERRPGPKVHPGIILQVLLPSAQNPHVPRVTVCYGTSAVHRVFPWDLVIHPLKHPREFAPSGLSHETRFDLSKRATLPFDSAWFQAPLNQRFGDSPKIGALSEGSLARLSESWAHVGMSRKRLMSLG